MAILDIERDAGSLVRLGPGVTFRVLVVCTGNSCRSPMAAGILAKLLDDERAIVESAGTNAPVGNPPTEFAVAAVRKPGVDISGHRARQLTREMVREADLVLVMESYHREQVLCLVPEARGRTRLLLEYAGRPGAEVDDPIGGSLGTYERTIAVMMLALERIAAEIKQRLGR